MSTCSTTLESSSALRVSLRADSFINISFSEQIACRRNRLDIASYRFIGTGPRLAQVPSQPLLRLELNHVRGRILAIIIKARHRLVFDDHLRHRSETVK